MSTLVNLLKKIPKGPIPPDLEKALTRAIRRPKRDYHVYDEKRSEGLSSDPGILTF